MISDAEIEKVLDWLTKSAGVAAKARAEREYICEYRKSLKAILMKKSGKESVAAQEVEAYAHAEYREHLEAVRMAVEADEKYRWLQVAAEAKIGLYRTEQATIRAQEKITS